MVFRLPSLPHVGTSTWREKQLHDVICDFIRQIERDRPRLLTIVLEGRERWRKVAGQVWRGYRIGEDDGALNAIYDYLLLMACPVDVQVKLLQSPHNTLKWRELTRQAMPRIEAEREALRAVAR
jgi:hypothetical protein